MENTQRIQKYAKNSDSNKFFNLLISPELIGDICLSSGGAVLNASIGRFKGKGSDEQSLLRYVIDTFKPGDLVLGDAFYGTYFF